MSRVKYNKETKLYEIFCNICGKISSFKKEPWGDWKCKHCGFISKVDPCKGPGPYYDR